MLIGLSATMLLLLNGRIAGIGGILGRLARGTQLPTNAAFVIGLMVAPCFIDSVRALGLS